MSAPKREGTRYYLLNAEEVVRFYSDMIYGVAMRYVCNMTDAEDVYLDVFYRYFRRERTFDSEEHRKAWLLRVTVNCSKDLLMKRTYHDDIDDDMFGSVALLGTADAPIEDILAVRAAIKKLAPTYREIVELYYFNELIVSEISRMLQRPVNTVKSQLLRGREELRRMLL